MAWHLDGTYFENCSCDMVCPCTTSGLSMPADQERCRVVLAFHVERGEAALRGRTRDLRVGVSHGAFCLACCWALMALLVAFGLMNVIVMVALAGAVLVEKTWLWGPRFSRALGVAALVLAIAVVFEPGLAPGLHHSSGAGRMGSM